MQKMIVRVHRTFSVEYNGPEYRQQALNSLQVMARESEGAGPAGFYKATEITEKSPSATSAIEIISDCNSILGKTEGEQG